VKFTSEDGADAGGVYREGMTRIVEDLFSTSFELLLPCANATNGGTENLEKFVPNSSLNDELSLDMFRFVGRMMALSLRVKLSLIFEFPLLIWKKLTKDNVDISDLEAIDKETITHVKGVLECDESTFESFVSLDFSYSTISGEKRLLKPKKEKVVFANRKSYCDLLVKAKIDEYDEQVAAIRYGFSQVLPVESLFLLCSGSQFEFLVCGSPVINLDALKTNTKFDGFSEEQKRNFWKVMESFSDKDRSNFLRYAWGRARYPTEGPNRTLNLTLSNRSVPLAHTCSFNVEIPRNWVSEADFRKGLTMAITYGLAGMLST